MESKKYKLRELITQRKEKNDGKTNLILGVSKEGFISPKQEDADTSIYNLFRLNDFIYNPARMELGSIAFNDKYDKLICSSLYEGFYVHRTDICYPPYLDLFTKLDMFSRYCNFLSNGSAREYCRFANICEIEIELPSLQDQKKIVKQYRIITDRIETLGLINKKECELAKNIFLNYIQVDDTANGSFADLIENDFGGDWGKDFPSGNYQKKVFCIRGTDIPNVSNGNIETAPIRYILNKNYETKKISAGELVIEISGGSPTQSTGRIAIIQDKMMELNPNCSFICSNFCRVIKAKKDMNYFILEYWKYLYENEIMFSYENSTTSLKNFEFSEFINEKLLVLPLEEKIKELNKILEKIYDNIAIRGKEIELLERCKKMILTQIK